MLNSDNIATEQKYRATNVPEFEYRKIQTILGDVSFSLVLPKQYAVRLGLRKGDFVKVHQEQERIVIEKS
jgi:hypothetical protein